MDDARKLSLLLDLAEELGVEIRTAPASAGSPGGALVRLGGRELLFLDPAAPAADQIAAAVDALRDRQALQDRFLPPELRAMLEADPPSAE